MTYTDNASAYNAFSWQKLANAIPDPLGAIITYLDHDPAPIAVLMDPVNHTLRVWDLSHTLIQRWTLPDEVFDALGLTLMETFRPVRIRQNTISFRFEERFLRSRKGQS